MRILLALLPLALMGQVIGVTSTQAVIRYTAPDSAGCVVTISPAANDLDDTKFSGAALDILRPSTVLSTDTVRTIVIGSRTVGTAADGRRYSRALFAETAYTVTICGSQTVHFVTGAPVVGVAPEATAGWPTIDPTNQAATYADPLTGAEFRLWGRAGDGGLQTATVAFSTATGTAGSWTNVANAATAGASYATSSGGAALVLTLSTAAGTMLNYGWVPERTAEDLGVYLSGSGASATAANRQVGVCLTVDAGATCLGTEITVTLPQTTPSTQTVPSSFPTAMFGGWGAIPTKTQIVNSLQIRVRKLNATSTVDVSAGFRIAGIHPNGTRAESSPCSPQTFTSGDGKTMRLCLTQLSRNGSSAIYAYATDGTVRYLGQCRVSDTAPTAPTTAANSIAGRILGWDPVDPRVAYARSEGNDGIYRIYRGTYGGTASTRLDYAYTGGPGGDVPASPADGWTWAVLLDLSAALATQTHYSTATYGGASAFVGSPGISISGDIAILYNVYGGQDRAGWVMMISLSTGTVIKLINTLNGDDGGAGVPALRWCGVHSSIGSSVDGNLEYSCNHLVTPSAVRNSGPYTLTGAQIRRSGVYSSNMALPWPIDSTYDNACPSDLPAEYQALGATGNNCVFMRISSDVTVNGGSGASESVSIIAGDMIQDQTQHGQPFGGDYEHMRIVRKTAAGGGAWDIVLQRDAVGDYCWAPVDPVDAHRIHAATWVPMMVPGRLRGCSQVLALMDVTGTETEFVHEAAASHYNIKAVPAGIRFISDAGVYEGPIAGLSAVPFAVKAQRSTGWTGLLTTTQQQGYQQVLSTLTAPSYNMTAYNGGAGYDAEVGGNIGAVTVTSVAPPIYRITILGGGAYKRSPLLVWAGDITLTEKNPGTLGDTLTSGDSWQYCYVYRDGECRTGSTAGQLFVVMPQIDLTGLCEVGESASRAPCAVWARAFGGAGIVRGLVAEANAETVQRISTVNGPWHYAYERLAPLPDAQWAVAHGGRWTDNWYANYLFRLPSFRSSSGAPARANGYVAVPVTVPVNSVIEFGYTPEFYCTFRAEACKVSAATINQAAPYSFAHETLAGSVGTTVAIPAIPGRVIYYRVGTGVTQVVVP